jgi:hypothetical protein
MVVAFAAGLVVVSESFEVDEEDVPAPKRFFSFPDTNDLSTKKDHIISTHR